MDEPVYKGECLCRSVRYRVTGTGTNVCYCHCRSCRGSSGAPLVAWATFDAAQFAWTVGAPVLNASSPQVQRAFCGRCGTALTYAHAARSEHIDITLATLVDSGNLRPEAHIWVSQKLGWVQLSDGLPQYGDWPRPER